ncbi:Hypothetical_protein [Hexamita inflata]|uniref:Hypothetical_protein n=1 Tax=Hexamita inflata TaxID=28002 RepID=A0AA86PRA5_9EUKA|nr:Hypothetical protein HINF_LOCUS31866 [Hexamita inflata]CAI9963541.1 Hypothetical protein HINF_LOCUS51186 [Hexamita inflata]
MSQSHGLTQFKTANIIKSKCVHITNLSPLLSEMFDEIQTPMINIQKCQDYVFNYNDHYSYAELTNIKQTVNDEIMYILNSNIYDYRQQLAHMKKANPKLLQFENLNISFQIARYKRFDISFEELSHIIPSEFLPEPEIVLNSQNSNQRLAQAKQRRVSRTQFYDNLQFQITCSIDSTPQSSQNNKQTQ